MYSSHRVEVLEKLCQLQVREAHSAPMRTEGLAHTVGECRAFWDEHEQLCMAYSLQDC